MVKKWIGWSVLILMVLLFWASHHPVQAQCSSRETRTPASIEFINQSSINVYIYWVNPSCDENPYGVLIPQESMMLPVVDGDVWVVRDREDNELARGTASATETVQLIITDQDQDEDGVVDSNDLCPTEAAPTSDGCPDQDGDGIQDSDDLCPTEADESGCPPILTTIPANRAPITPANAGNLQELGSLRMVRLDVAVNGSNLLIPTETGLSLYDLTQTELTPIPFGEAMNPDPTQVTKTVSSSQAATAATFFYNQTTKLPEIAIWDLTTQTEHLRLTDIGNRGYFALSPDGTRLAVSYPANFNNPDNPQGGIKIFDVAGAGNLLLDIRYPDSIGGIAFSPDGSRLAGQVNGLAESQIIFWDAMTGAELGAISGISYSPAIPIMDTTQFSPDGSQLVSVQFGEQTTLRFLSLPDLTLITEIPLADARSIVNVAFSPDASLLAVIEGRSSSFQGENQAEVGRLHLIEMATGTVLKTFDAHEGAIQRVIFSDDGSLIITSGGIHVKFWGVPQ